MITVLRYRSPDIRNDNTLKAWASGNLLRGLRDRDVAQKPTWMYLRRSRKRIPGGRAVEDNSYKMNISEADASGRPVCAGPTHRGMTGVVRVGTLGTCGWRGRRR